jgi:phosphoenolpyruvate carboxykinase (ATP)
MNAAEMVTLVNGVIRSHPNLKENLSRATMIQDCVDNQEAWVSAGGALVTMTPPDSTGRSPQDTVLVRSAASEDKIDWDSPNNIPITEETFEMLLEDAVAALSRRPNLYVTDRALGADSSYALPVKTVTSHAYIALFSDNMFRPVPADISKSLFNERPFTILDVPYDQLDPERYKGRLRNLPDGSTTTMCIAGDIERRICIVYGSAYCGSLKKMMFTVMNYLLPDEGILPLHASANEGADGSVALFLGLSGTGKTTLSTDPERQMLGDDEHGWSANGVANFENGCYAKMIDIDPTREPEIYDAVMHQADYREHGAIVENALMYPDGTFDYNDRRLTENSRASYPLAFLKNIKPSSEAGQPNCIVFLTADANGVLPPVAWLSPEQAMLWFLMGYTSKLAGTETGIVDPVATFSRFFGQPFMPRHPGVYSEMLGDYMQRYQTDVYLVNTGWSGGPYGVGKRMDIKLTRAILSAVIDGKLKDVAYDDDPIFHLSIPQAVPGVKDQSLLKPRNTWDDQAAYEARAQKLAAEFAKHYDKWYQGKGIADCVAAECPGR